MRYASAGSDEACYYEPFFAALRDIVINAHFCPLK